MIAGRQAHLSPLPAPPWTWPRWADLPALQQPGWDPEDPALHRVRRLLSRRPPLVRGEHIDTLRALLAQVAEGRMCVVQAGDCAEDPFECGDPEVIDAKVALLDRLAMVLRWRTKRLVVRVGRIAGQFAKPRSSSVERVGDVEIASYRGSMINGPEATPENRQPNPLRMLLCHRAATSAMEFLDPGTAPTPRIWTSHEALVLDYELPQLRQLADGRLMLTSTHWPWVGERTRHPDGAHIALLSAVANPVACKVGPSASPADVLTLCRLLDPHREPGRLTLISRMSADLVEERLPTLVDAVRQAGYPVIWMCDPMHGNTVTTPDRFKTRLVPTVIREVQGFQRAVAKGGGVAGGLHLETTPAPVTECVTGVGGFAEVGRYYTSLCDPRLNPDQAAAVAGAWDGPVEGTVQR